MASSQVKIISCLEEAAMNARKPREEAKRTATRGRPSRSM